MFRAIDGPVVPLFSEKSHPHNTELTEETKRTEDSEKKMSCVYFSRGQRCEVCLFLVLLSAVIHTFSITLSTIPLSLDGIV